MSYNAINTTWKQNQEFVRKHFPASEIKPCGNEFIAQELPSGRISCQSLPCGCRTEIIPASEFNHKYTVLNRWCRIHGQAFELRDALRDLLNSRPGSEEKARLALSSIEAGGAF